MRVPLTRAGKTLFTKLAAADRRYRRYRRKHRHGHKLPSAAAFKVTLRYTPTSGSALLASA